MAKSNAFAIFTCELGVATTAAEQDDSLDGIDTNHVDTGAFGWVKTGPAADTLFRLDLTSAAAPDGTTVIAPLVGPGRWLEFSGGGGGGGCLTPRTKELFVDANTAVAPIDQNGSLSCPFDSIGAALALVTSPDPSDLETLFSWEINCAPGIYDEDVSLPPVPGASVTLRGISGGQPGNAPTVGPTGQQLGPGVFIADPTNVVTRTITIDYSGATGTGGASDVAPLFVFEAIACEKVEVDGDGSDALLLENSPQTWMDCVILDYEDISSTDKYTSTIELRNSTFDLIDAGDAKIDADHSAGGDWSFIGRLRSEKCIIGVVTIDFTSVAGPSDVFDLTDTFIAIDLDEFNGGLANILRLDSNTAFFAEFVTGLSTAQLRYVQDLTAQAFQHYIVELSGAGAVFMLEQASTALGDTPVGGKTVTVPDALAWSLTSPFMAAGQSMSRQFTIKNRSLSAGTLTVSPSGGDTIEGGAGFTLAPGEGVIMVARTTTDWEIIASVP